MTYSRRQFLHTSAAVGLGMTGLQAFAGCLRAAADRYGPLLEDPDGIIDLPAGFKYQVISRVGSTMSDGFLVPGLHDGMATFPGPGGTTLLVRNHEMNVDGDPRYGAFGYGNGLLHRIDPDYLYDAGSAGQPCLGGVTTVVYNTRRQAMESDHLSLVGTLRNCAGGPTPWGTWVTCEETFENPGEVCAQRHGYCFEVPASATPGLVRPVPLTALGRYYHEAVAVDPRTGIVYLTEDDDESLIYRFIPDVPGDLIAGGRLQALVVQDAPSLDTRNWDAQRVATRERLAVTWLDLGDIDPDEDDLRLRGHAQGAARFARGEGMWYGSGTIYFACTSGGPAEQGQIFAYEPARGMLTLFVEAEAGGLIDRADNLTVAPWGHVVVCEDSAGRDRLIGVTQRGEPYLLARNALSESELAGAVFSPDGTTLFVNLQHDGLTLAITGPWIPS